MSVLLTQIDLPDPAPTLPGRNGGKIREGADLILGIMKWGGLAGSVGAMIASGVMMAVGRRNRNHMAVEGAVGIPWVFAGITVVMGSTSLVGFMLD